LPKNGNKYTVALVHSLIFGVLFYLSHKLLKGLEGFKEGAAPKKKAPPPPPCKKKKKIFISDCSYITVKKGSMVQGVIKSAPYDGCIEEVCA
jgi:hypothetical protein